MNELIGLLEIQSDIPATGLKELVLKNWKDISEALDDSVLESLFSKCNSLTTLSVTGMYESSTVNRMVLAQQVAMVLKKSQNLQKVDFNGFSEDKAADEGKIILSALSNSICLPQLSDFSCSLNPSWFSLD